MNEAHVDLAVSDGDLLDHRQAGHSGPLLTTAASFNADAKERRISNLMELAASHRDLWLKFLEKPELARILRVDVDLKKTRVTVIEERFVHLLISHLAVSFAAYKSGILPELAGLQKDVQEFFALPIPKQVWQWSRMFQQSDFVAFVDSC
ncbi:MAG: hypothetical protein ACOYOF_15285 [Verrucomicrobiaceae bacterium]